jgi:hypothetical protein
MKQQTYEKVIYIGVISPLTGGSLIFFYWFWQRAFQAINIKIELISFFTMIAFLIFGSITLICSLIYFQKFRKNWKRLMPALFIATITIPAIILYGTIYDLNSKKAFILVINDDGAYKASRIWSANFEIIELEKEGNRFVASYEPVYVYDWTKENSFGYEYKINDVFIDLVTKDHKLKTLKLPKFEKGVCDHFKVSELEHK